MNSPASNINVLPKSLESPRKSCNDRSIASSDFFVRHCALVPNNKFALLQYLQSGISYVDEVVQYQAGRYTSSNEAVWCIVSFPIHERIPAVVHLVVHLENGQRVFFGIQRPQKALNTPDTTLTAFFALCQNDSFAKILLYSEVPTHYTWNANKKSFERRKGVSQSTANLTSSKKLR